MSSYRSSPPHPPSSPRQCETQSTSSLPLGLIRIVLSHLPTIPLLKFRPVRREWRDTIDDPRFAALHAASDGASCHGLLCFDSGHGATYLLNPLTRGIFWLPNELHRLGIGVDRLNGRYKIVRVKSSIRAQGSWSWRYIASLLPSLLLGGPVLAAGSIHWSVAGGGRAVRISSFNVTKKEFASTPCPEPRDESMDVWAMEESGLWAKKYRIQKYRIPRMLPPCMPRWYNRYNEIDLLSIKMSKLVEKISFPFPTSLLKWKLIYK
ncbi:hypothetical protein ACJRO7_003676 [Eucalyptus globulus]|uniref:F-box domain-containing protein n=1 Tax=Eucalyptus globulus TaxID=34317 RepID=A0ABD3IXJ5_EUCGL